MSTPKTTEARLLVRYGKFRPGEVIKGGPAAALVERGMAKDVTPRTKKATSKKKKAPENKAAVDGAPENKEFKA